MMVSMPTNLLLQDCTGDKGHHRNSAHDKQADYKRENLVQS
jgi:hypothetical protein